MYYYSYSTITNITGCNKHIRIHQAIADLIKIVNYANQNSILRQLINMELKQNLLEIGKNSC